MILDRSTLVMGFMEEYKIDLSNIIAIKINNRAVSIDTTLSFQYLLTQICQEDGC